MFLVKKIINSLLRKSGYEIRRFTPKVYSSRVIYNAYYRGGCFKCIKDDPLTEDILQGKGWDNQIFEILKTINNQVGVVVEIGANIGASILPYSKEFPELKFELFEPVPAFYEILKENYKYYNLANNVSIKSLAFGSSSKEFIEINVGLGTAGKTSLVHYQMKDQALKIKCESIDEYFSIETRISLIKLDVDGFELGILRGGENYIKRWHPQLFLEFAPKVLQETGQSPEEFVKYLQTLGYNFIKIWDHESNFVTNTNDWEQLLDIGNKNPHYLNILVSLAK